VRTSGDLLLAGGLSFRTRWADLTIGATFQGSSESAQRLLNLPEEGDPEIESDEATIQINQWRFLFGFSFPFQRGDDDEPDADGNEARGDAHGGS
jgi:hypothetical protein